MVLSSTCARIGRKPEGDNRRRSDVLGLAEGDEDVSWLDVQVRKLLLVQVLQASGYLKIRYKLAFCKPSKIQVGNKFHWQPPESKSSAVPDQRTSCLTQYTHPPLIQLYHTNLVL